MNSVENLKDQLGGIKGRDLTPKRLLEVAYLRALALGTVITDKSDVNGAFPPPTPLEALPIHNPQVGIAAQIESIREQLDPSQQVGFDAALKTGNDLYARSMSATLGSLRRLHANIFNEAVSIEGSTLTVRHELLEGRVDDKTQALFKIVDGMTISSSTIKKIASQRELQDRISQRLTDYVARDSISTSVEASADDIQKVEIATRTTPEIGHAPAVTTLADELFRDALPTEYNPTYAVGGGADLPELAVLVPSILTAPVEVSTSSDTIPSPYSISTHTESMPYGDSTSTASPVQESVVTTSFDTTRITRSGELVPNNPLSAPTEIKLDDSESAGDAPTVDYRVNSTPTTSANSKRAQLRPHPKECVESLGSIRGELARRWVQEKVAQNHLRQLEAKAAKRKKRDEFFASLRPAERISGTGSINGGKGDELAKKRKQEHNRNRAVIRSKRRKEALNALFSLSTYKKLFEKREKTFYNIHTGHEITEAEYKSRKFKKSLLGRVLAGAKQSVRSFVNLFDQSAKPATFTDFSPEEAEALSFIAYHLVASNQYHPSLALYPFLTPQP